MADHEHKIAKYELLMEYSGYCEETRGYVYGYRETCDCGASRISQYKTAHDAAEAHAHLDPRSVGGANGNPRRSPRAQ